MSVTTANIIILLRGLIDDFLKTDGLNAYEYDADNSFQLSEEHVASATIKVYQNGTLIPATEYTYNSDTNKITITFVSSGYSLTKGDNIITTFNYYDRFSDTELIAYIKSSLVEFSKNRYKKTFYMNSSNEVVTLNRVNPTIEEGNLIAAVAGIKIDPKNIKISYPGVSISAEENKSPSQQIAEAIAIANVSFGSFGYTQEKDDE